MALEGRLLAGQPVIALALRNLTWRPWRSALLFGGFGLGVGVMIVLLSIGEAMLSQARDEKLVGGGDVTVLPEGLDLEVLKTGGIGGLYISIPNARFVHRQLLAAPRQRDVVAAAAPQIEGKLLYVTLRDGAEVGVRAGGEIPSLQRAVGAARALASGTWEDDALDRRWRTPTDAELRHDMDHFHLPPAGLDSAQRRTWGEWHYANVISPDGQRWAFMTWAVGGDVPDGEWGGQLLVTLHERGRAARRFLATVPGRDVRFSTTDADLQLGTDARVEVLSDGRYRFRGTATELGGVARVTVDLVLAPRPGAYFPGADIGGEGVVSGYAVPALVAEASGRVCAPGWCQTFDGAQGYHDHNWGVWRRVEWEWGSARAGQYGLLYGRVQQADSSVTAGSMFVYLVDSLGFRALFRPSDIRYDDTRLVRVDGVTLRVPARAVMQDARGADTLRVELTVDDAMATDTRRQPGAATRVGARPWFIQMQGRARITGRVGGAPVVGEGRGFFESYRGDPK